MTSQAILVASTAGAYILSSVGYAAAFHRKTLGRERAAFWGLLLGWILQTVLLGFLTLRTGQIPLNSQVLPTLCAWLVVIVYAYLELTTRDRSLGALVVPIVALLHILSAFQLGVIEVLPDGFQRGSLFKLHVLAYILAYVAFAIACVSSVMYVMLLGELQKKHLGFFYDRLPPLETLDQTSNRAVTFGFVFLTTGIVVSSIWASRQMLGFVVWQDPSFASLLLTWVIYACHLGVRWVAGWQGRRAALFSIVGFSMVILTFPVVGVLFSGKHSIGP